MYIQFSKNRFSVHKQYRCKNRLALGSLWPENQISIYDEEDINKKVDNFHTIIDNIYEESCPEVKMRLKNDQPCWNIPLILKYDGQRTEPTKMEASHGNSWQAYCAI